MTDLNRRMDELKRIVETWNFHKTDRKFNQNDMRDFIAQMNANTRMMISAIGVEQSDFYEGLAELCVHAQTMTTKGARVIADGIDRTDV